jgi:D-glycero-D-manno-heptose 1,7-bisphosphate phosphatase
VGIGPLIKLFADTDSNPVARSTLEGRNRRAIFLDRDGVLIDVKLVGGIPHPASSLKDVSALPGAREACASLKGAGLLLIVVTNQPDIARGSSEVSDVLAINQHLIDEFELDAVYTCPHDDPDGCRCRKPAPGLITEAASDFGVALQESIMVGDRWRDIEAGRGAGCRTIWIRGEYEEPTPIGPDAVMESLKDAAPWILSEIG